MNARTALLIIAALTLSERAGAQDARPVRFWINVTDFTLPSVDKLRQYVLTPGAPIPTSLVGWTCKAEAATYGTFPATKADPAHGIQAAPPAVYQSADLTCASKAGSIKAIAICRLTAEDEFSAEDIKITDVAGHQDWVGIACRN